MKRKIKKEWRDKKEMVVSRWNDERMWRLFGIKIVLAILCVWKC